MQAHTDKQLDTGSISEYNDPCVNPNF